MKRLLAIFAIAVFAFVLPACKGKVDDASLKTAVDAALTANPDFSQVQAAIAEGAVTLSGDVKDDATKAALETAVKAVKGVKSVENHTTLPPPAVITPDDPLTTAVKDAVKDNPTVTASVAEGVVTLSGNIKKAELAKLLQKVMATHPKKVENKLTVN